MPSEMGNDHKNLLHTCRRHLCPDRASSVDPDCDGLVHHVEWRRYTVLAELDCRHCGGHVELRRLQRRHAQLKAGRTPEPICRRVAEPLPYSRGQAVVLYRYSDAVNVRSGLRADLERKPRFDPRRTLLDTAEVLNLSQLHRSGHGKNHFPPRSLAPDQKVIFWTFRTCEQDHRLRGTKNEDCIVIAGPNGPTGHDTDL